MKTAAITTALIAALVAAGPIEVRQTSGCKQFSLLFARGTTEPGVLGSIIGPGLKTAVESALGADAVNVVGIQYPATIAGITAETTGSGPGSIAMANQADELAAQCPDTQFILTGYSQGGMVVHNAAKKLSGKPIVAAVTFGDPFKGQGVEGVAEANFKSFCGAGDTVCVAGGCASSGGCGSASAGGHLGYRADANSAAQFIQSAVA